MSSFIKPWDNKTIWGQGIHRSSSYPPEGGPAWTNGNNDHYSYFTDNDRLYVAMNAWVWGWISFTEGATHSLLPESIREDCQIELEWDETKSNMNLPDEVLWGFA